MLELVDISCFSVLFLAEWETLRGNGLRITFLSCLIIGCNFQLSLILMIVCNFQLSLILMIGCNFQFSLISEASGLAPQTSGAMATTDASEAVLLENSPSLGKFCVSLPR